LSSFTESSPFRLIPSEPLAASAAWLIRTALVKANCRNDEELYFRVGELKKDLTTASFRSIYLQQNKGNKYDRKERK
jgi:hypothetical protein